MAFPGDHSPGLDVVLSPPCRVPCDLGRKGVSVYLPVPVPPLQGWLRHEGSDSPRDTQNLTNMEESGKTLGHPEKAPHNKDCTWYFLEGSHTLAYGFGSLNSKYVGFPSV